MLAGIILFACTALLAVLLYAQRGEKRRHNKEVARISARIKKEKLEELKDEEIFDVDIIWGDVITILETLKIASKRNEGVQGVNDLKLLISNRSLIVKKQGEHIRIQDIAHLQKLVDTYDSKINISNIENYTNTDEQSKNVEQVIESIKIDANITNHKKESYLALANIISGEDSAILKEINFYCDDATQYFEQFYFDFAQRGIKDLSYLTESIVLVDAMERQKKIIYCDKKSELYKVLNELDKITEGTLSATERYRELYEQAQESLISLDILQSLQGESVFECINDSGYSLLSINDGSQFYALFLIPVDKLSQTVELAKEVNINLDFSD